MKLTVIGHWGAYPEAGDATSCYLLEHDNFKLLIDCGSGALSQLQNFCSLHEIDALIISHYHHDHIADIGPLQYSRLIDRDIDKTAKPLMVYGHPYDQEEFQKLAYPPHVLSYIYNEEHESKIGPFTIRYLETQHKAKCFAMRIELNGKSIVYTADSSYMETFNEFANEADLFICETSFYAHQDGKPYGHMNSIEAATIANDARVQKLVLTHLPHFGDPEQLVKEAKSLYKGDTILAKKGLEFVL
ncbi:MBL fold metallo-hydrolase [Anaerobacillus alkaliphilus]|uniref:MBL fold metallo-hydrolase n=1 Tax=Anaerobacillus alkaliphilus TaxID=1548597 RepID=A0A4Q0VQ46_9BACI|nr:MBL fold metallo-hydrolase [Anaerobacillus alkaliphilus]RXI98388.1 MBL fold metallo-hydrolase [Anaerobacillus alkaliphilus]